jgi:hypothetical protein
MAYNLIFKIERINLLTGLIQKAGREKGWKDTVYMLITEMKAAIKCKWIYIITAVLCYLILPNVIRFYIYPGLDTSEIDHLTFIIEPMAFTALAPFAALFCILPYSMSFCDEYNSGYS